MKNLCCMTCNEIISKAIQDAILRNKRVTVALVTVTSIDHSNLFSPFNSQDLIVNSPL